jgi:hypothetical protein
MALIFVLISIAEKVWNVKLKNKKTETLVLPRVNVILCYACAVSVCKLPYSPFESCRETIPNPYKIRTALTVCRKKVTHLYIIYASVVLSRLS